MTRSTDLVIGAVDPEYAVEAEVVAVHSGDAAAEWSPYADGGTADDGLAVLLVWRQPSTGAALHIVASAPVCTSAAVALAGLRPGDVVAVEGCAAQLLWPAVLGELVVVRELRDVELVRRAEEAGH